MKREYSCDNSNYYMQFEPSVKTNQEQTIDKYWGRLTEMITGPET